MRLSTRAQKIAHKNGLTPEETEIADMSYATDILARRSLIVAAFRVIRCNDFDAALKKAVKRYGSVADDAVAFASIAKGNCMAAKEDDVDSMLSVYFGWTTIAELRRIDMERIKKELQNS